MAMKRVSKIGVGIFMIALVCCRWWWLFCGERAGGESV